MNMCTSYWHHLIIDHMTLTSTSSSHHTGVYNRPETFSISGFRNSKLALKTETEPEKETKANWLFMLIIFDPRCTVGYICCCCCSIYLQNLMATSPASVFSPNEFYENLLNRFMVLLFIFLILIFVFQLVVFFQRANLTAGYIVFVFLNHFLYISLQTLDFMTQTCEKSEYRNSF